jgi:hypothetical protein
MQTLADGTLFMYSQLLIHAKPIPYLRSGKPNELGKYIERLLSYIADVRSMYLPPPPSKRISRKLNLRKKHIKTALFFMIYSLNESKCLILLIRKFSLDQETL